MMLSISKLLLLLTTAQIWTVIAVDPKGDGRDPSSPDAAQLSYRYDQQQDMLWFRVSLYGTSNTEAVTLNVTTDPRNDDGAVRAAETRVEGNSVVIGMKRTDLTSKMKMNLVASVGSDQERNDDIPNGPPVTLDLSAPRTARGLREIDVSRNNFLFPSDYKTLTDDRPPRIKKTGRGGKTLILIPGVYSGKEVFEAFIARNQSQYQFYVVTPAGLNGTRARPLPAETVSYGELPWTRWLERDILELIRSEKLSRPVIVTHGFPGSLAAHELAIEHPDALGGVIDVAGIPLQYAPSLRDPSGKTLASADERVETVNQSWAKWFKYVTPETWESNNYPAVMFTNDLDRAERVRRQVEAAPLPVKIRYLSEFMASDVSGRLATLTVPLLALRPGFSATLLADPATGWFKPSFQDSWDALSRNPQIKLLTIPNARALILDDQPRLADDAIAAFIHLINKK